MDSRKRARIADDLRTHAAEQDWTRWELVQAVHVKAETPTLLMAWRLACGHTQRHVIDGLRLIGDDTGTPCSPNISQLSRWEAGADGVGPFYRRLFALFYGTSPASLGFPAPPPPITSDPITCKGDDDVDRRSFLGLAATTTAPAVLPLGEIRQRLESPLKRLLPTADLAYWTDTTDRHITAYGTCTPADLLVRLSEDLDEVSALANRYSHQRDLQMVAARLCGLTGALHTDLNDEAEARTWLTIAGGYARLAEDAPMRTWVAMAQAMLAYYGHRPDESIQIAEKARRDIGDSASAGLVQLTGLTARAHARLGDHDAARQTLAGATTLFSSVPAEEASDGFFGFPEIQLSMYESSVLSHIGDAAAWNAQTSALDAYAGDPLSYTLISLDRARWQLQRGKAEDAALTATTALEDLRPAERLPLIVDQAVVLGDDIAVESPQAGNTYKENLEKLPGVKTELAKR
ncbi:hypothetical protein [Salinactinospora qingdaonensis]|uniref:hypothetical protein n=1 Tax=Salinactinospora qingdaonensis TaxID=702744 RepID=UPI0031EDB46B